MKYTVVIHINPQTILSNLTATVESIRHHSPYVELVLVDNGSGIPTDGLDFDVVIKQKHDTQARAWNIGIATARTEYIISLSDNVRVCKAWIESMVETFETEPSCGIVGPSSILGSPNVQFGLPEEAPRSIPQSCFMLHKDVYCDPFEPAYKGLTFVDYLLKIKRAGYKVMCAPLCIYAPFEVRDRSLLSILSAKWRMSPEFMESEYLPRFATPKQSK